MSKEKLCRQQQAADYPNGFKDCLNSTSKSVLIPPLKNYKNFNPLNKKLGMLGDNKPKSGVVVAMFVG